MRPDGRVRPWGEADGKQNGAETATTAVSTLPPPTVEDWERAAAAVNGAFCVVVYVDTDRVRRRLFLTLAAAERHAERARARGQECSVVLAELRPAFVLPGIVGDSDG